jgi:hypothetical protein
MGNKSPQEGDGQASAQPRTEGMKSHQRRILKAHLTLADRALGPLTAVLLVIVGILARYQYFWAAGLFLGAAVLVFVLLFHLRYRHEFHRKQKLGYWTWTLGIGATLFALTAVVVFLIAWTAPKQPTITYFGALTPDDVPVSPLPPDVPVGSLQLWLGYSTRVIVDSPTPILGLADKPFLSVKIQNGSLSISATILDKENQPICRIIDNEFQCYYERAFNPEQPDPHSLVVRNESGDQVLNLRFLNPTSVRIIGRFQIPGFSNPVLITPAGLYGPDGGGFESMTIIPEHITGNLFNLGPPKH